MPGTVAAGDYAVTVTGSSGGTDHTVGITYTVTIPTTVQAGNWNDTATWTAGVIPGAGAASIIDHAVAVTADQTVGHSPAAGTATPAILIRDGGSVTIAEGKILTVRGDIAHNAPTTLRYVLDLAGGSLYMDPTAAADPTTAAYVIGPTGNTQPNAIIRSRVGAGGTRPVIKTLRPNGNEAQAAFSLNGHTVRVGLFTLRNTDFLDLGNASTPMANVYAGDGDSLDLQDNTFTRCGMWEAASWNANTNIVIDRNTWIATTAANPINMISLNGATGTREFIGNALDKTVNSGLWGGFTVKYNVLQDAWIETSTGYTAVWEQNVIYKDSHDSPALYGPLYKDFYFLTVWTGVNPQGLELLSTTQAQTIDGMIGQLVRDSPTDIEQIVHGGSNAALTKTVKNSLFLAASNVSTGLPTTNPSGCMFVGANTTQSHMEYFHNTYKGGDQSLLLQPLWLSHPTGGTVVDVATDTITAYKSNLYWDTSARGNHVGMFQDRVTPSVDILRPSGATHNAAFNWTASDQAGSIGTPYRARTTTAPGANDLNDENPRMLDPTRNFEGFAALYGQPRTPAATLAILRSNPTFYIPQLIRWVREGHSPTNFVYKGRGHDGADIGAVPVSHWNQPGWGPGAAF
jgi:hypothetical protein